MSTGWIKLHRKILDWEWYDDPKTFRLFIHCLLKANHKDKKWRGNNINRGSFITSLSNLSLETGLSLQQVRTCLDKLESTNEINKASTSVNTCITIINYDDYQSDNTPITNDQQTSNKRVTTTKNDKNVKNEKNISPLISDYSNIKNMEEPLTKEQGEILIKEYGKNNVEQILLQMENWKPLTKKNKSANLTAQNWLKRNNGAEKEPEFNPANAKRLQNAFR